MAGNSPWPLINAEREALIDDLGTLTDEQWAMIGRSAVLAELSGAGVDTLKSRSQA
jgi:hypothetical protein